MRATLLRGSWFAATLCVGLLLLLGVPGHDAAATTSIQVNCTSDPGNAACQPTNKPAASPGAVMPGTVQTQAGGPPAASPRPASAVPNPSPAAGATAGPSPKPTAASAASPSPKPAARSTSPKPAAAASSSPKPAAAAASPSPKPPAAASSSPKPPAAASPSPKPPAAASPSPKPPAAASPSPKPPAAASPSPKPPAAASPSPKPVGGAAAAAAADPAFYPAGSAPPAAVPAIPTGPVGNVVYSPVVMMSPAVAPAGGGVSMPNAADPAVPVFQSPSAPAWSSPVPLPLPVASPVPLPVTSSGSPAPPVVPPASPVPAPAPAKPSPSPVPVKRSPSPSPSPKRPPPPQPLYTAVAPSVYTQVDTWVDTGDVTIPKSFMGISHEWPYIEEVNDIPEYSKVIQTLTAYGGGPMIIRVGGGSTDHQTTVPDNEVWSSMAALYRSTRTRYILGLNFYNGDVGLARRQMQAAWSGLPADAVMGFEIGNEPNFYMDKNGKSGNDYVRCCFINDWRDFAYQLSCPQGGNSCISGQFMGPVWGHINMYPTTLNYFLSNTARWVKLTTVHWYKATAEAYNTAATLLEEDPIRKEADNLAQLVRVSNSFGKPLRVAEMNTISNSGRRNVSDVFASALWTLDMSFEVAQAGGVGVNFHQGAGQNLYAAWVRWAINGQLQPPLIRPAFYGMLMFNMAVRGSSRIMNRAVNPYNGTPWDAAKMVKIWPLQDNETGELRWVIINKHDRKGSRVRVRINRQSGYSNQASVTRLVARGTYPLTATSGITIGGQWYGNGAAVLGSEALETLGVVLKESMLQLEVDMPPGSAALVRLPRASAV